MDKSNNERSTGYEYKTKPYEIIIKGEDFILMEKFIGNEISSNYDQDNPCQTIYSWNQLMLVVDKFFSLGDGDIVGYVNRSAAICEKLCEVDIYGVHENLVEAIKWLNSKDSSNK